MLNVANGLKKFYNEFRKYLFFGDREWEKKKMCLLGFFFESNKGILTTLIDVMEKEIELKNSLFDVVLL